MDIEIQKSPMYSMAVIKLKASERIRADVGSMIGMTDSISIDSKAEGGIFKSVTRELLGGETFYQNFFQASLNGGEVTLAPALPGDMAVITLSNSAVLIQSGAFLASETQIELNARVSMKAFMAAEGVVMLEANGTGKVLIASYGAIIEKPLTGGQKYVVDSAHLAAFESTINVQPRNIGGLRSGMYTDEGLVVELTGPGKVWLQTRSPRALLNWMQSQLPKNKS